VVLAEHAGVIARSSLSVARENAVARFRGAEATQGFTFSTRPRLDATGLSSPARASLRPDRAFDRAERE
jgi:hypothetical protein